MRKLKAFVAVLMLVFVLGLAVPQALAGEVNSPPTLGETQGPSITEPEVLQTPPGETQTPSGITDTPPALGETQGPGFATWAKIIFQILGNGWNI